MRPRFKPDLRRYPAFNVRLAKTDCAALEQLRTSLQLPTVYRLLLEMVQELVYLCQSSPFSLPANSRLLQLRSNEADRAVCHELAEANVQRPLSKAESTNLKISFPAHSRAAVGQISSTLHWSDGQVVLSLIKTFCELAGRIDPIERIPDCILRYRALMQREPIAEGGPPSPLSAILFQEPRLRPEPASQPPTSVRLIKSDLRVLQSLARTLDMRNVNRLVVNIVLEIHHLCASSPFRLGEYQRLLKEKVNRDDQATWYQLACENLLRTAPNAKSKPIRVSFPGGTRSKIAQLADEMGWCEGQVIVESIQTFCLLAGASGKMDSLPGILRQAWVPRSYSQGTGVDSAAMVTSELNRCLGLQRRPTPLDHPVESEGVTLEGGLFQEVQLKLATDLSNSSKRPSSS